jgi:hypothetical protein
MCVVALVVQVAMRLGLRAAAKPPVKAARLVM